MDVNAIASATKPLHGLAAQDAQNSSSTSFAQLMMEDYSTGDAEGLFSSMGDLMSMLDIAPTIQAQPSLPTTQAATLPTQTQSSLPTGQQSNSLPSGADDDSTPTASAPAAPQTQTDDAPATIAAQATTAAAPQSTGKSNQNNQDDNDPVAQAVAAYVVQSIQNQTPITQAGLSQAIAAAEDGDELPQATGPTASTGASSTPLQAAAANPQAASQAAASDPDTSGEGSGGWMLKLAAALAAQQNGSGSTGGQTQSSSFSLAPQSALAGRQAAGLAQSSGQSNLQVSVQSSNSSGVAAQSTSTLVPEAVLATPGFGADTQTGGQTAGDSGQDDQLAASQQAAPADANSGQASDDEQIVASLTTAIQNLIQEAEGASAAPQVTSVSAASSASSANLAQANAQTALPATAGQTQQGTAQTGATQQASQTQNTKAASQTGTPSPVEQIKVQIEKGLQQGATSIKVQLSPQDLGRVEVKLNVQSDGSVKATVIADRADTLNMLRNDSTGLQQALRGAGLNADSSSLSFYLRGGQQQQYAQGGQQQSNGGSDGDSSDDDLGAVAGVSGAGSADGAAAAGLDISV